MVKKSKYMKYSHYQDGDTFEWKIRDQTWRVIQSGKFNVKDKNERMKLVMVLEKYGFFVIADIMKMKNEWV